jgi:hypothetical protein
MLEKTLRFWEREQYIAPQYKEQIEEYERKQNEAKMNELVTGLKAMEQHKEATSYEEGIEHTKKVFWPLLFACAIASDCADLFPIVGTLVKIIVLPIIWYHFYIVLRAPGYLDERHKIETSYKFRILIWALGFTDLLTYILPLTTVSVFIVWYRIKKQTKEKEKELLEIQATA